MTCFLACFGDLKGRKHRRKSANKIPSTNHILKATEAVQVQPLVSTKQELEKPIKSNEDSPENLGEQIDWCGTTEVTSDPIFYADEVVSTGEVVQNFDEIKKEEKRGKEDDPPEGCESNSNLSNTFSLPASHRYANCPSSDDEYVVGGRLDKEEEERENDDGDEKNKILFIQEESSESFFSLSINSRKQTYTVEGEKEVNSPAPIHNSPDIRPEAFSDKRNGGCSLNVDSVLNPIENVTHQNSAKVKTTAQHLEKENINSENDYDRSISPEPSFQRSKRKLKENYSDLKPAEDDIAVDTSLSNWLVESETTPRSKNSTSSIGNSPLGTRNSGRSYEDRPILGALTLEELKQFSAFSTPRRSRSRSPDETPIIGTVGSYWSHIGQDTDSNPGSPCRGVTKTARKCREDERVNWNSTPFLERLDRALASNSANV